MRLDGRRGRNGAWHPRSVWTGTGVGRWDEPFENVAGCREPNQSLTRDRLGSLDYVYDWMPSFKNSVYIMIGRC